jgi:hypothetical protein
LPRSTGEPPGRSSPDRLFSLDIGVSSDEM